MFGLTVTTGLKIRPKYPIACSILCALKNTHAIQVKLNVNAILIPSRIDGIKYLEATTSVFFLFLFTNNRGIK